MVSKWFGQYFNLSKYWSCHTVTRYGGGIWNFWRHWLCLWEKCPNIQKIVLFQIATFITSKPNKFLFITKRYHAENNNHCNYNFKICINFIHMKRYQQQKQQQYTCNHCIWHLKRKLVLMHHRMYNYAENSMLATSTSSFIFSKTKTRLWLQKKIIRAKKLWLWLQKKKLEPKSSALAPKKNNQSQKARLWLQKK